MAYVVIALCFGIAGGIVARVKGNSVVVWFLIAAIVPFIGLATAILHRSEGSEPRRECPRCGKVCLLSDALCTRCGMELEFTRDTIA